MSDESPVFTGLAMGLVLATVGLFLLAFVRGDGVKSGCIHAGDVLRHSGQEAQAKFVMENCR